MKRKILQHYSHHPAGNKHENTLSPTPAWSERLLSGSLSLARLGIHARSPCETVFLAHCLRDTVNNVRNLTNKPMDIQNTNDTQASQLPQLTKQERYLLRQQQKQELQESHERKKWMKKAVIWTAVIIILGGSGYGLYYLSSQPGKPRSGTAIPILGQDHIAVGAFHPPYNSDPPTSGWHYEEEASWGVQEKELLDEQLIHNLEHGGIWISYTGIDDATKSALEKIARSEKKVIVEPRVKNNAPIILASWGRLLKLDTFDEQAVMDFIETNRNQAPEPFAE